jgi:hypothetical protein
MIMRRAWVFNIFLISQIFLTFSFYFNQTDMNRKCVVCVMLLWLIVQSVGGQERVIYSHVVEDGVVVDGREQESAWWAADSVVFDGKSCGSENVAVVKTLWDSHSLYLLFKVSDANLQAYQTEQDHRQLFLDDMAEFLIDTANDRDSCWNERKIIYHINLLGAKKDDRGTARCYSDASWNGEAVFAVAMFGTMNRPDDVDEGYQVEVAIPWQELESLPEAGLTLGVNFAVGDNNNAGRQLFDWVGARNFRSPHLFGRLVLKGADATDEGTDFR